MSSSKSRETFTASYKAKVALEAIRGLKTISELAQEYNVHPQQIGVWKKAALENLPSLFEGKRGPIPINKESDPERLYSKIGKLEMHIDWLKKKSGISL